MDPTLLYTSLSIVLLFLVNKLFFQHRHQNLPPSPNGLPIIGHLHLLKPPIHSTLLNLSQKHGPILSLRFGFRRVVVVSSSSLAHECFTKNDVVLANRPRLTSGKYLGYNYSTIFESPYGDHWRNLRQICALEIFSTNRLNMMFTPIRQDEVKRLISCLYKIPAQDFVKVDLNSKLSEVTFNVVVRMVAGKRYYGEDVEDSEEGNKFRDLIREISKVCAATNPGDFLPFFKWIDYTGHEKDCARIIREMDAFLQGLIDEHRKSENKNTMVDNLLFLQKSQPEYYSDQIIKGLILAILNAGTDTISGTLEWAMSLLLNHPKVLEKAKSELDIHVGNDRLVEEQDLSKLSYLHWIIQETQRLFPAGPLLGPHESSDNCQIGGYDVPRGTIVLVNAWAIHRDTEVWDDATSFKPERFEKGDVEVPKLLPFGMGRRACPGSSLAYRVMELALASLIQCFEWKRVNVEKIDLAQGMGLTMHKVVPLEAMCKARDNVANFFPTNY